jgi:hypothetical protein
MLFPRPIGWPIPSNESGQPPVPPGGIAPLRHDLALANYLEKRAAHGAPALCQFSIGAALRRLCAELAGKWRSASLSSRPGRHVIP